MKAVFLTKFGTPEDAFEIRETEKPRQTKDQVLIKVEAFGLNFADVLARTGLYPSVPDRPCILGYEVVGTIVGQGADVPNELIGKRVVALTRFGGYAEFAATDYRAIGEISSDYPADKALALGTQYTTAYVCAVESMNLYPGDRILVHAAAGGVGIALCQLALNKGCEVFATAGSDEKIEFLKKLGVQHPINYRSSDYSEEIEKILKGKRLDASYNSLAGKSVKKDLKLLGSGGKLVIFGAASRVGKAGGKLASIRLLLQTGFITPLALIMGSKTIIGINILNLGDSKPGLISKCMQKVIEMAEQKHVDPVIFSAVHVSKLNDSHSALEGRKTTGKLAVFWEDLKAD